jgi:hypothetical protein
VIVITLSSREGADRPEKTDFREESGSNRRDLLHMVDQRSDAGGSESIIDIDYGDIGSACVQHP